MSSSVSSTGTPTSSVSPSTSSDNSSLSVNNSSLKVVGIILAIVSGLLIGSSFVFKKKGLLKSQAGQVAGEGVAYLKSWLWWLGMIMMILGEICNFGAYAFVEAIVVTPLGALSVVVCAILSSIFLKEKLTFFGWLGCGLCIIGSTIIALNGPKEETVGQIRDFQKLFLAPGFLAYASVLIAASLVIIFFFAPKYGKKSMLWYISVCSMIGGISVSVTTGLGAAIVTTARGDNQFKYWFMYFLIGFVAITLITEVYYLNVALALFNTAMVTPTYYVIFTFFSMLTTVVLFQGLHASATDIITLVMGFLTICIGITILQMSKVDPVQLSKLDRRSTILLQAARQNTETVEEKGAVGIEDPGMDALRGSFGTVGSIIRARSARRLSQSSRASGIRIRPAGTAAPYDPGQPWLSPPQQHTSLDGVKRHQLYDPPMPSPSLAAATRGDDASSMRSDPSMTNSQLMNKRPTIKFDNQDVIHQYHPPGTGNRDARDDTAMHQVRPAHVSPGAIQQQLSGSGSGDTSYPLGPINTGTNNSSLLFSESPSSTSPPPPKPQGQILSVPMYGRNDQDPASAPPTMYQPYRPPQMRKDSREVFADRDTLLSFPSVTDSARSLDGGSDAGGSKGSRGRTPKKYPKGAGDDDREESVSLWRKDGERTPSPTDELSDGTSPTSIHGGIRLVPTSGGPTKF
ncbi:duf803 domain membrane protein [Moniliophthora roreri MCA 2997]|uniref:Duf803 domain membrane protein n=2 Tax=Moniliophthora roreri TaxID=221103 RepID=V2X8H8_MONRO|nr:duf803 domain membrane protein [Moniliophthora roreri MCA 2997]KAI3602747.1 duf803 domain membrane protein [Moniliophthora roreri]